MPFTVANTCQRALGYLELGMAEDAWEELRELPREADDLKEVRQLRVETLVRLQRWEDGAALCIPMLDKEPGEVFWWIQGAYCERRARTIEGAERILRSALMFHPADSIILYNLACYACVQNHLEESKKLLEHALALSGDDILVMALKDDDLGALHSWILSHRTMANSSGPAS